jgi:hypothetical protein
MVAATVVLIWPNFPILPRASALVAAAVGVACGMLLWWASAGARVFREGDRLFVRSGQWHPVSLPLRAVECFFRGRASGPTELGPADALQVESLILRIAEREQEWQSGELAPVFGKWCGGYITLNGLWCEPLSPEKLIELNRELVQAKRSLREDP